MLSETYEVDDIKDELEVYGFYGYASDALFETAIEKAITNVMYEKMYPIIGESVYDTLEAKDKTGLTTTETYLYLAEVYYATAEFCLIHARKAKYKKRSAKESRTEGTVTYSNSGTSGKEMMANDYITKGDFYMSEAGYGDYVRTRLARRQSVHAAY